MSRILVTGGAGFIPSHLCDRLLADGHSVVAVDNLSTGRMGNLSDARASSSFEFVEADVCDGIPVSGAFDVVMHMASPASPIDFERIPIEIMMVGSVGTRNALELAKSCGARFLLASTSEVYGDPKEHPQKETYRGNVSTQGPRSVYDEAKRFSEAITAAYGRHFGLEVRIARIFNTYGPRMRPSDGRVISNFIRQALCGEPLTVYGDGSQTRSFCHVKDEVRGLLALLWSNYCAPVNIGNPTEYSVSEVARRVIDLTGSVSPIVHEDLPVDDPKCRRPDIGLAQEILGWEPVIGLDEGIKDMVSAFLSEAL